MPELPPNTYWIKYKNWCVEDVTKDPFEFYVHEDWTVEEWVNCTKDNGKRKNAIYEYLKEHKENPTIWYDSERNAKNEWDITNAWELNLSE